MESQSHNLDHTDNQWYESDHSLFYREPSTSYQPTTSSNGSHFRNQPYVSDNFYGKQKKNMKLQSQTHPPKPTQPNQPINQTKKFTCNDLLPMPNDGVPSTQFACILLEALYVAGWRYAFGIPGTCGLYLFKHLESNPKWQTYLVRNERNAGFIANGTARASCYSPRKLSFAFAAGPGATNLVTAVADSMADNQPALYIITDIESDIPSGNITETNRIIRFIEPEAIFGGVAKLIFRITEEAVSDGSVLEGIFGAMQRAYSEPAGPLILVCCNGSLDAEAGPLLSGVNIFENLFVDRSIYVQCQIEYPDPITGLWVPDKWNQMMSQFETQCNEQVIDMCYVNNTLSCANKPIVVLGLGCKFMIHKILKHLRKLNLPYILTLPMAGFATLEDPLYAQQMGHTATYVGNKTVQYADWVLCVGTSLNQYQVVDDCQCFANADVIISLNKHPELYSTPQVTNYLIGDVCEVLRIEARYSGFEKWIQKIKKWRVKSNLKLQPVYYKKSPFLQYGVLIGYVQTLVDKYLQHSQSNCIICTDSGMHQPLITSLFNFKSDRYKLVTSHKFAPNGCGLGTAMGCALQDPQNLVVLFTGDTGITLAQSDLITIKEAGIHNLLIIMFENSGAALVAEETHSLNLPPIRNANGYIYSPMWKGLFDSALLKYHFLLSNKLSYLNDKFEKISSELLKSTQIVLCLMEHDTLYSPFVKFGTNLLDMNYYPGGAHPKFTQCRINNIANGHNVNHIN